VTEQDGEREGLTVWQILWSTLAAMLGVQKNQRRVRDFSQGRPYQFIIAGLIAATAFVLLLVVVVQIVLRLAGV
jgi:uncharacterized membrane protein YidH (DUF202 family)